MNQLINSMLRENTSLKQRLEMVEEMNKNLKAGDLKSEESIDTI